MDLKKKAERKENTKREMSKYKSQREEEVVDGLKKENATHL